MYVTVRTTFIYFSEHHLSVAVTTLLGTHFPYPFSGQHVRFLHVVPMVT